MAVVYAGGHQAGRCKRRRMLESSSRAIRAACLCAFLVLLVLCAALVYAQIPELAGASTTLRSNTNGDRIWDEQKEIPGALSGDMHVGALARVVSVRRSGQSLVHEIRPTNKTFPPCIAATTVDMAGKKVVLEVAGFIAKGRIILDFARSTRTEHLMTSTGRIWSTEIEELKLVQIESWAWTMCAFDVITTALSELVVVDVLLDAAGDIAAVRTTAFFDYKKALCAVTRIRMKASQEFPDIPPLLYLAVPSVFVSNDDMSVRIYIMADDLKADVQAIAVTWGDGGITRFAAPGTGRLCLQHNYRGPGSYVVQIEIRSQAGYATCLNVPVTISRQEVAPSQQPSQSGGATSGRFTIRVTGIR